MKKLMRGFTMIELLVVIAIIGVLAAAVLSAINPVEQINKGRDTRLRSDAAEMVNASDRYYAVQELFPWNEKTATWNVGGNLPAGVVADDIPENAFFSNGAGSQNHLNFLDVLQTTDEVKSGFVDRVKDDADLFVFDKDAGSGAILHVCFSPRSRQFRQEAVNNCEDNISPFIDDGVANSDMACNNNRSTVDIDIDPLMICIP